MESKTLKSRKVRQSMDSSLEVIQITRVVDEVRIDTSGDQYEVFTELAARMGQAIDSQFQRNAETVEDVMQARFANHVLEVNIKPEVTLDEDAHGNL